MARYADELEMDDILYYIWAGQVQELVEKLELTDMIDYELPETQLMEWNQLGYSPEQVAYTIQMEGI